MSDKVIFMVDYEYFSTFTSQWFPGRAEMYMDHTPTIEDRKELEQVLYKHKGKSVFIKRVEDMEGNLLFATGSHSWV